MNKALLQPTASAKRQKSLQKPNNVEDDFKVFVLYVQIPCNFSAVLPPVIQSSSNTIGEWIQHCVQFWQVLVSNSCCSPALLVALAGFQAPLNTFSPQSAVVGPIEPNAKAFKTGQALY